MSRRNRLLLKNLPNDPDLTDEEVLLALRDVSKVFSEPEVGVELFEAEEQAGNSATRRWGVVFGLSMTDKQFTLLKCSRIEIRGRSVTLHTELGDERTATGRPKFAMESIYKRRLMTSLFGDTTRKVSSFFSKDFLVKLAAYNEYSGRLVLDWNWKGPDFFNDREQFHRGQQGLLEDKEYRHYLAWANFEFVGSLIELTRSNNMTVLTYGCVLDVLQAIRYLNQSKMFNGKCFLGFDSNKRELKRPISISTCCDGKGLGSNQEVINVAELVEEHGFVPVTHLDPEIFGKEIITVCIQCEKQFAIIGIDANLNFLAATCGCRYSQNPATCGKEILSSNRAVTWFDETDFTRLVVAPRTKEFIVSYQPMKMTYASPLEYARTCLPLLKDEWNSKKRNMATNLFNVQCGLIGWQDFGVTAEPNHDWIVRVIIKETSFWTPDNIVEANRATVEGTRRFGKRKAVIENIVWQNKAEKSVAVSLRLSSPVIEINSLTITPKPSKTEYSSSKQLLKDFADRKFSFDQISAFLGQSNPTLLPVNLTINSESERAVNDIKRGLTTSQNAAVEMAIHNSISVIHGPPGTGKTTTVASLVNILSSIERSRHKKILICCPTNVACNVVSRKVFELAKSAGITLHVLRVFSVRQQKKNIPFPDVPTLHDEIAKSEPVRDMMKELQVAPFGNMQVYDLLPDYRIALEEKIAQAEKRILQEQDVFVTTIGCVADHRLECVKDSIYTAIVDEAGEASEVSLINVLSFSPKRAVFAGDPEQLSNKVDSSSCFLAGMERSFLERVQLLNRLISNVEIPWTTLTEQHRMVPLLRQLTSEVFYNGILKDSIAVLTRDYPVYWNAVAETFNTLAKTPLIWRSHKCLETKSGTSYFNVDEIRGIITDLKQLITCDVNPNDIAVCTMYEAQREFLVKEINQLGEEFHGIECRNVDGYQGREKNFILLSLVRSNEDNLMGFTVDSNRLNVAFSRAKFALFLYGNKTMLQQTNKQVMKNLYKFLVKLEK